MTRALPLAAALALAAGCMTPEPASRPAHTEPAARPASPARPAPASTAADVRLGGISLVGTWAAVVVRGDAAATRDLERGLLEQTLIIRPGGHAILTGADRREGSGAPLAFGGEVRGDRLAFAGMPGAGRLQVQGHRLLLHDPRGRTTEFARVGR